MQLNEFLCPDRVIPQLRASDKAHLIDELAREAAARLAIGAAPIAAALSARERLGTTGLGRGFALPHARLNDVEPIFGLFARLARPVDFGAIDGLPVDLVFLLLIPSGEGSGHVTALAAVARAMRDDLMVKQLRTLRSAPALYRCITGRH